MSLLFSLHSSALVCPHPASESSFLGRLAGHKWGDDLSVSSVGVGLACLEIEIEEAIRNLSKLLAQFSLRWNAWQLQSHSDCYHAPPKSFKWMMAESSVESKVFFIATSSCWGMKDWKITTWISDVPKECIVWWRFSKGSALVVILIRGDLSTSHWGWNAVHLRPNWAQTSCC